MSNLLSKEKSPYLLQHADNPVDWYPWGKAAFAKAKREDKPIFLSIGYSTCHWCHVMERESFEDEDVAELLNEVFVCVKVDREERPDLDGIYMRVCQMTTGSGGWPLTVLLTPEGKPFFAGTYFPKDTRYGRMGMFDLIAKIKELWTLQREGVEGSADQISAQLKESVYQKGGDELSEKTLEHAFHDLHSAFDAHHGGFGIAPKFPTPHQLLFLLRYWKQTGEKKALEMVERTLMAMRRGGIHDQLGGGFHRYATDQHWLLPHFEKMLYDQALLAMAYVETFLATENEKYAQTARDIFTYVLTDLTSPEGAFYSAEDADSEGEEGKFYVWKEDEFEEILGRVDADLAKKCYNTTKEGNFADEVLGSKTGANILHRKFSYTDIAKEMGVDEIQFQKKLGLIRSKLLEVREKRIRPFRDDKVLADWNGLMIAALAKGSLALGESLFVDAAKKAFDFFLKEMFKSGKILHRYRDGGADIPGNIDDYAFISLGALELYEATLKDKYLQIALDLMDYALQEFWDGDHGGFFFTSNDSEKLIARMKESYDGAVPSGNSVAMMCLLRLARMTGNTLYEDKAVEVSKAFSSGASRQPSAHTMLLCAVNFAIDSQEIVIVGKRDAKDTQALLAEVRKGYAPNRVVLLRDPTDKSIAKMAPFTKDFLMVDGKASAYVCKNFQCERPVTDPAELRKLLG